MFNSAPQVVSAGEGAHLVLYDGVCGLCRRLLQFLLVHDRARIFKFASLQSPTGRTAVQRSGNDPDDLTSFYVVANYRTSEPTVLSRGRAALFVARMLGWPWRAACLLGVLPTSLLDRVYGVVARNRYRVFGCHERCLIPRPEDRNRFVDS
jgi:predicted DCC family thiol-disulfide oxidoreductase YuxK